MTKDEIKGMRLLSRAHPLGLDRDAFMQMWRLLPALLDALEAAEREAAKFQAMSEADIAERRAAERERDAERAKREESDKDLAEIEGIRQAVESRAATARGEADALRRALVEIEALLYRHAGLHKNVDDAWTLARALIPTKESKP